MVEIVKVFESQAEELRFTLCLVGRLKVYEPGNDVTNSIRKRF